jgi:hypothetical protein
MPIGVEESDGCFPIQGALDHGQHIGGVLAMRAPLDNIPAPGRHNALHNPPVFGAYRFNDVESCRFGGHQFVPAPPHDPTRPFIPCAQHARALTPDIVPESLYEHGVVGNTLFYLAQSSTILAVVFWLIWCLIAWNVVFPAITFVDVTTSGPLRFINPILGVLILWSAVLGLKKSGVMWLIDRFDQVRVLKS